MVLRPNYLEVIENYIDVKLVKILTGVRRCGKSTILLMVQEKLLSRGIESKNIIARNYSSIEYEEFSAKQMYDDLKAEISNRGRCYLFLDELQEIEGWEKVLNTLLENEDVDLYVTGSNSKLMSSEISTYLSGRYVTIPVYTLSFKEFMDFKKEDKNPNQLFEDYLYFGGFPLIAVNNIDRDSAYQIVSDIYSAVVTNDIAKRHKIRNRELFDRVVKFIIENVGKTFSANSIVKYLKGESRTISVEAIYNYIKWLSEAFVIYPCRRYDLQGKSVLKTQEKYYLSDISLKYSKLGFKSLMISSMLENIVFLEMKRRGYEVYIGKYFDKEIDFVATRKNEKIYVQVCRNIPEDSNRETENLNSINDHYHKYVVCLDTLASDNENGIEIVNIVEFLLKNEW